MTIQEYCKHNNLDHTYSKHLSNFLTKAGKQNCKTELDYQRFKIQVEL